MHNIIENIDIFCTPSTLTILPTYRCTAACKECCFESSPKLKDRITLEEICSSIEKAVTEFPTIKLIVFSGGECFVLGDELFEAISYAKSFKGISVRCVSNAYWGKRLTNSKKIVERLVECGLDELNISTGLDHQKWVSLNSVMNAAKSTVDYGIRTLVTIEADTEDSKCLESFVSHKDFLALSSNCVFSYQVNSWMPFHEESINRKKELKRKDLNKGCAQLMENIVLTPHGRVSACCGLTFEHIPEMILGTIEDSFQKIYHQQVDDLLKLWIKTDGPLHILETIYGDEPGVHEQLDNIQHQCHACVLLHQKDRGSNKLGTYFSNIENIKYILNKVNIRSAIKVLKLKNKRNSIPIKEVLT